MQKSWQVLPLNGKVNVLEIRKKIYFGHTENYSKNESSVHEVMKEKEICVAFHVTSQNRVCDKFSVKMEKTLHLWVQDMNQKIHSVSGMVVCHNELSYYKNLVT